MTTGVRSLVVKSGRNAGRKMARFQLENLDGTVSGVVFAHVFETVKDTLREDAIVFVSGRVDRSGEDAALLVDSIEPADTVVAREVDGIVVRLQPQRASDSELDSIASIAQRSPGQQRLLFDIPDGDACFRVRADRRYSVTITHDLLDDLAALVGKDNLSFTRK